MKLDSMRIRKVQRIFSIAVLVVIIVAVVPRLSSEVAVQVPTPKETGATKLMIFHEGYNVEQDKTVELTIRAVDNDGTLDTSRNDTVELNATSLSYAKSRSELSATTLKLQSGVAKVTFIGHAQEMVRMTVNWKNGKSELKSGMITIHVGIGGE
jgi:hypothetical protein